MDTMYFYRHVPDTVNIIVIHQANIIDVVVPYLVGAFCGESLMFQLDHPYDHLDETPVHLTGSSHQLFIYLLVISMLSKFYC